MRESRANSSFLPSGLSPSAPESHRLNLPALPERVAGSPGYYARAYRRCGNFTRPRKFRRNLYHTADILTRKASGNRLQASLFSVLPHESDAKARLGPGLSGPLVACTEPRRLQLFILRPETCSL